MSQPGAQNQKTQTTSRQTDEMEHQTEEKCRVGQSCRSVLKISRSFEERNSRRRCRTALPLEKSLILVMHLLLHLIQHFLHLLQLQRERERRVIMDTSKLPKQPAGFQKVDSGLPIKNYVD